MRFLILSLLSLLFISGCALTETDSDEANPSRTAPGRFFMSSGSSDK